jgi:RNA polymerase sigma-70 factor (ECF subfamily)
MARIPACLADRASYAVAPARSTIVPAHDRAQPFRAPPVPTTRHDRNDRVNDSHPRRSATPDVATDAHEAEWLRSIAGGDRRVFERLYLRYHGLLTRFLARFTTRRDLVDEIVNETMWVVWRSAGRFRGESRVGTWIIGIAYRSMMKALRDRPASSGLLLPEEGGEDLPTQPLEAEQAELRDWIRQGMAQLPPEQRMTMELAYYLGQSCEEIATVMNCAVGTVKARMFHARLRLRNTLPALGGERPIQPVT